MNKLIVCFSLIMLSSLLAAGQMDTDNGKVLFIVSLSIENDAYPGLGGIDIIRIRSNRIILTLEWQEIQVIKGGKGKVEVAFYLDNKIARKDFLVRSYLIKELNDGGGDAIKYVKVYGSEKIINNDDNIEVSSNVADSRFFLIPRYDYTYIGKDSTLNLFKREIRGDTPSFIEKLENKYIISKKNPYIKLLSMNIETQTAYMIFCGVEGYDIPEPKLLMPHNGAYPKEFYFQLEK